MINDILKSAASFSRIESIEWNTGQWGGILHHYDGESELDLKSYDLAIITIGEINDSERNRLSVSTIRDAFCQLYAPTGDLPKVLDLGNILPGATIADSKIALEEVLQWISGDGLPVIVIAEDHSLTAAQLKAAPKNQQFNELCLIDSKLDLLPDEPETISAHNHLYHLFQDESKPINHCALVASQQFFNPPSVLTTFEKLGFRNFNLGALREDFKLVEPLMRNANAVSFDLSAIRESDAPGRIGLSVNGLTGEEACQLSRYSGLCGRLTSFGIYGFDGTESDDGRTAQLVAQMLWYFIDGFNNRIEETPDDGGQFIKYTVDFEEFDHQLIYWKSKRTNRWWFEFPDYMQSKKKKARQIEPCTYADYVQASSGNLPDRFMDVFKQLED